MSPRKPARRDDAPAARAAPVARDAPEPAGDVVPAENADAPTEEEAELESVLDLLFQGKIEAVLPPEELPEFHDFIREEALRRRRFAVSLRMDSGSLAWIGYALSNVVTHEEGIEFKARAIQTYVPDYDAGVEMPEGPNEDPPEEFEDWPIWPMEIYQDEAGNKDADPDDALDLGEEFDEIVDEAADDLHLNNDEDLADIRWRARNEDDLRMDDYEEESVT